MKRIIESTMQRVILVIICIILILAWGGVSAFQMQRDYLPGINNTTLLASLRATAYQADQMKKDITSKIEDGIRISDGLVNVETTSYDGGMLMNLYLPMNFDMGKAESEIKQALNNDITETALRSSVQTDIVQQLKSVPGVAEVHLYLMLQIYLNR